MVFIVALILCGLFYMIVGGVVVDWIMDLKGIEGLDAHSFVMTYAFQTAPMLTIITALIIMCISMFKSSEKPTEPSPSDYDKWEKEQLEDEDADFK